MSPDIEGFIYLLVAMCDMSNYVIEVPLKAIAMFFIEEALIHIKGCIFCPTLYLILYKQGALTENILQYILDCLKCTLKIIPLYNYGSLETEGWNKTRSPW